MDRKALLELLVNLFTSERKTGLLVDMIGVAPAYEGIVNSSYILAVSAPSLANEYGCSSKVDRIIDVIYDRLTPEQRSVIDRVRVYNSAEELKQHAQCNFDHSFYGYCEGPMEDLQAQTMSIMT